MPSTLGYDGGLTISIQCKDRKKSLAWYQDILGFKLLYEVEEIGWCELQTEVAGGRVNIGLSQVETLKSGAGPVPTFGVKDIDAARKKLEAKDVRFDGKTREYPGMVKLATFFDPDGTALMLYQDLSGQS
jgi:catechol 2,3-dioxygenase-like lactoylglutathione lyase family enzyme